MNIKTKMYIRIAVIFLLIFLAFFIDYMHHGNLTLFLITTAISLVVLLISARQAMKIKLKIKKKWKMPTIVKIMYGISFAILLVAISTNSSYPSMSVLLFIIAFVILSIIIKKMPKEYTPKIRFPFSRFLMIIYILFLIGISIVTGVISMAFFLVGLLELVSLYSFLKPKRILLVLSIIFFTLIELLILTAMLLVSNIILYIWLVINTLGIAYTFMLFKNMKLKKSKKTKKV